MARLSAIVSGGYLRETGQEIGHIDPHRFAQMARFLFDSGVLKDAQGAKLRWPGDVSGWFDQSWMQE